MKKRYYAPEEEFIIFNGTEVFNTGDSCTEEDCSHCFFLVCEPEDVIIGKVKQSSGSKKSSESPKNPVGFDMTFDR